MPVHRILVSVVLLVFLPGVVFAQSREEHNVETLEQSDVGPYRPDHKPDFEKAASLIVQKTNEFRRKHDRSALSVDSKLKKAASYFAGFMARTDKYGHRADDNRPAARADKFGYEYCIVLENIAYQFSTQGFPTKKLAERFVDGWINSPGHRENMLDADVTEIGVAVAQSEKTGVYYAVQMFGRPKSKSIEFRIANRTASPVRYEVGKRSYSLPAKYTRTHRRCRPGELTLMKQQAKKSVKVKTVKPDAGDRFVITQSRSGELQLAKSKTARRK